MKRLDCRVHVCRVLTFGSARRTDTKTEANEHKESVEGREEGGGIPRKSGTFVSCSCSLVRQEKRTQTNTETSNHKESVGGKYHINLELLRKKNGHKQTNTEANKHKESVGEKYHVSLELL